MDENYLDQLLKNVEEDDVVTGSGRTGVTEPEKSDMALDMDMEKNLETDSSNIQGVAWSDAEIPTEEISELDELDKLADMDMNDMDFADIDFDDIDVTKMDYDELKSPLNAEDINDLQIDEKYLDEPADNDFEQEFLEKKQDESAVDPQSEIPDDTDIDAMFKEVFGDEGPDLQSPESVEMQHIEEPEVMDEQEVPLETEEAVSETEQKLPAEDTGDASSGADMDDLFAMLGLDANTEMTATVPDKDEIPDFEIPPEMEDLKDIGEIEPEKKKKSFMDVLFGEDDSDEPTPEELEEKRQKKEEQRINLLRQCKRCKNHCFGISTFPCPSFTPR